MHDPRGAHRPLLALLPHRSQQWYSGGPYAVFTRKSVCLYVFTLYFLHRSLVGHHPLAKGSLPVPVLKLVTKAFAAFLFASRFCQAAGKDGIMGKDFGMYGGSVKRPCDLLAWTGRSIGARMLHRPILKMRHGVKLHVGGRERV